MAKPTRYTLQERRRKQIRVRPPLVQPSHLLRVTQRLRQRLGATGILAAQALRRCVELEDQLGQALDQLECHCGGSPNDTIRSGRALLTKPLEGLSAARFRMSFHGEQIYHGPH